MSIDSPGQPMFPFGFHFRLSRGIRVAFLKLKALLVKCLKGSPMESLSESKAKIIAEITTDDPEVQTAVGGIQQVIVKDSKDARQIQLIRQHLSDIAQRFARGDFSAPTDIHGEHMPGLADLKKAKTGEITVHYQDLVDGGQIEYATQNANLVAALHKWIDAQLSDHGPDAHEGNEHQHQDMVHQ